jgi:hypothetical protein
MSIFGRILGKIFGTESSAATPAATAKPAASPSAGSGSAPTATSGVATSPARAAAPMSQVDVAAVLNKLAAESKEKLDWRHSIVDLMKLLQLDSSLGERKELAKELGYTADTSDSAAMNVWLHKQVMRKLAENGGKVPDDLKD